MALHVYSNGTDWMIDVSAEAALEANAKHYELPADEIDEFKELPDDRLLRLFDGDDGELLKEQLASEWCAEKGEPCFLGSKEY